MKKLGSRVVFEAWNLLKNVSKSKRFYISMNKRSLNDCDCLIGLGIIISFPADQAYDSIFDIRRQEASQNPIMEKIS